MQWSTQSMHYFPQRVEAAAAAAWHPPGKAVDLTVAFILLGAGQNYKLQITNAHTAQQ